METMDDETRPGYRHWRRPVLRRRLTSSVMGCRNRPRSVASATPAHSIVLAATSLAQSSRTQRMLSGHRCRTSRHRRTGRERPHTVAVGPRRGVARGVAHAPTPSCGACSSAVGAAQNAAPFPACAVPQFISKPLSLSGFRRPETARGLGSCEVRPPALATTGGDNSPPTSCLPVCLPNSRVHDVPTKEERWRYGRASTWASKRPAPRVMASASAGELVASMILPPSRNQARWRTRYQGALKARRACAYRLRSGSWSSCAAV